MTAEELRVGNYVNYKTFTITHPDGKRNTEVNREKVKVLAVDGHNNRVLIKPKSNRKNYTLCYKSGQLLL